jgi:nucleotide-binding universal stress UspA family protein
MGHTIVSWSAFRNIIVPLDGSELAETALEPALAIAHQQDAELVLMRAPQTDSMAVPIAEPLGGVGLYWPEESLRATHQECLEYLQRLADQHRGQGVPLRVQVVDGHPDAAILQLAESIRADLIIMSTHGYSGVTRWVMGSVTEKVLRGAQIPVFVIRGQGPLRKMLLPLDGSAVSETALEPAFQLARALGATVTLFQAVTPAGAPARKFKGTEGAEPDLAEAEEAGPSAGAQNYLRQITARFESTGVPTRTALGPTPAAEQIVDYADRHGEQLIAMATHGRNGWRRWIYGSVTEKVLHRGCCSMLIVPPLARER